MIAQDDSGPNSATIAPSATPRILSGGGVLISISERLIVVTINSLSGFVFTVEMQKRA